MWKTSSGRLSGRGEVGGAVVDPFHPETAEQSEEYEELRDEV